MSTRYKLSIKPGCVNCGCCEYILQGWPENYPNGLEIGAWAVEANDELIDKLIASCKLDLIELTQLRGSNEGTGTGAVGAWNEGCYGDIAIE